MIMISSNRLPKLFLLQYLRHDMKLFNTYYALTLQVKRARFERVKGIFSVDPKLLAG